MFIQKLSGEAQRAPTELQQKISSDQDVDTTLQKQVSNYHVTSLRANNFDKKNSKGKTKLSDKGKIKTNCISGKNQHV